MKLKPFNEAPDAVSGTNDKAPMLIAMCFEARTVAHMAHLQTKSFAEHIALNEFYSAIIGLTDSYAESFQGIFGIIYDYPEANLPKVGLNAIKALRSWIDSNRVYCGANSELQNDIDSILTQCNSTIYKLTYLA